MLNVLSLFSGVGGFDYGLENAGMKTVFQCEIDKHCQQILHRHWPDVPKWEDIQTLTGKHILENAGAVDVVAWGSPCQDLSLAGKRAGLAGESSGLFHEGIRIIKELRKESNGQYPRVSIWENVMGSLSSNGGSDFGRVIDEMAEAGALVIEWRSLDSRFFGIPQRRRRVFVVAVFDPAVARDCPDPILPVTRGVYWNSKTSAAKRESTSRKIGNGIESNSAIIGSEIVGTLSASDAKQISNQYVNENKCVVEPLLVDGTRNDDLRLYEDGIVRTMRARMGTGGGNTPTVLVPTLSFDTQFGSNAGVFEDQSPTLKSSQQSPSVLQEPLTYDGYNQTLSNDGIHRSLRIGRDSSDFIAQEENKSEEVSPQFAIRRLTPLECERLMGWPDNWTEGQSDSHRYKQCGNGVASPVAEWIGEQVLKIWSKHE
jgi:DNA (cytosine-5)-methyltransferase 1